MCPEIPKERKRAIDRIRRVRAGGVVVRVANRDGKERTFRIPTRSLQTEVAREEIVDKRADN